jgi:hypothetical protein
MSNQQAEQMKKYLGIREVELSFEIDVIAEKTGGGRVALSKDGEHRVDIPLLKSVVRGQVYVKYKNGEEVFFDNHIGSRITPRPYYTEEQQKFIDNAVISMMSGGVYIDDSEALNKLIDRAFETARMMLLRREGKG